MAKLMSVQGAGGCAAGAYYSPALQALAQKPVAGYGEFKPSRDIPYFFKHNAGSVGAALFANPLSLALRLGGGYVVGREFGAPWLGAIGAGLFGILGLLGAVLIGASKKPKAKANCGYRRNGRKRGRRRGRRGC